MSFSTMSNSTVQYLSGINPGGIVCQYQYSPEDGVAVPHGDAEGKEESASSLTGHTVHAICWRGHSRTLNVMCGKTGTTLSIVINHK